MRGRLSAPLVRFISTHVRSVWALELMLLLMREPDREWTVPELVHELRASAGLIGNLLAQFEHGGLAIRAGAQVWHWNLAHAELNETARNLRDAYRQTPFAVIQTIAETPSSSISDFANAFRLRGDRDKS
jgi:hypothetical protein